MEANGGSCLAPLPPESSALPGPSATAASPENASNRKVAPMETRAQAKTLVESSYPAAPEFSDSGNLSTNTAHARGGTDDRAKKRRAYGLGGKRGRQHQKGSTVNTAWDALVDTFAQCYFTLRRDERGCHALSPPLPARTAEGVPSRKNALCVHEASEGTTRRGDATPLHHAVGWSGMNRPCLLGAEGGGHAQTDASIICTTAPSPSVAGAAAAVVNALVDQSGMSCDAKTASLAPVASLSLCPPQHLPLCTETKRAALSKYSLSTSSGAEDAYTQHQATSALTALLRSGKQSSNTACDKWVLPLEEQEIRTRRKGIVSDAKLLDKLTRQMIADLQHHFALHNGAVSAAEFVYIFRQLFRRYDCQSGTAATTAPSTAASGAPAEMSGPAAAVEEKVAKTASWATEQLDAGREFRGTRDLLAWQCDSSSVTTEAGAAAKSLGEFAVNGAFNVTGRMHQINAIPENALMKFKGEDENEVVGTLEVSKFDHLHPLSPGKQLGQQQQEEEELLELQQLLDVFALIDVNDSEVITWEQFTRFIIDRGRNEDFLKRLHLQRLEGRDMKETRLHLTPVESLTVAYDPPFSLDLVFYFEENSKTVEVLTPDAYPCSALEQAAAPMPLQCSQQAIPSRLPLYSKREHFVPSPETPNLSAAFRQTAEGTATPALATAVKPMGYSLPSIYFLRDSFAHHRVPINDPIRHSFTITAIAYCPSVQHLAVAAADLSLSFYDVKHAGLAQIRRRHSTDATGNLSPVRSHGSPIASADAPDRRSGAAVTSDEGSCWKVTRSFKTRTSQIILYPSPGRPLLFSADHEGSIYAWDLLRICRAESAANVADAAPQWWGDLSDGRVNEPAGGARAGGGNRSVPSSFPHAAPATPRSSLLAAPVERTTEVRACAIKGRRKAMRFDGDVTATAAIDLGTLVSINRPQQQLSSKINGSPEVPTTSTAPTTGKERGRSRRAIVAAGSGSLPPGRVRGQKSIPAEKDTGGGPAPNIPPLKLPITLQAGQGADNNTDNSVDDQLPPSRNRITPLEKRQTTSGSSAASRFGSSRTDRTSGDPPSSFASSNGGRSLSSATRSVSSVFEKGGQQQQEQQHQRGRHQQSGLREPNGIVVTEHYRAQTAERLPRGTTDPSAPNSSASASAPHGLSKSYSTCSSFSQKSLHSAANRRQHQFSQQQRRQKDCNPHETANEEIPAAPSPSSSCSAPPGSPDTEAGSRNGVRCRSVFTGVLFKHAARYNIADSSQAVRSHSTDVRDEQRAQAWDCRTKKSTVRSMTSQHLGPTSAIIPMGPSTEAQQEASLNSGGVDDASNTQRSGGSKGSAYTGLQREGAAGGGTRPAGVPSGCTAEHDGSTAGFAQSTNKRGNKTMQEDLQRMCSNASTRAATKGVEQGGGSPSLTAEEQQKWNLPLERLGLQQQAFTAAEPNTYIPRDGRSGSSTRTATGVLRPYTCFTGRLGAATSVPSEPQSHLLRWRQMHAHSDIVSGFQELEGGTDMLASCGMDKRIIIWSASTGEQKRVLDGHVRGIRALCFDVESRVLLSGGFDYKLFVWNPYVGKKVHTIRGHSAPVVSICMLAGGGRSKRQFLSCDSEGIVKTWDLSSSACLQTLLAEDLLPASGGQLRALVPLPHRQMLLAAAGRKLVALVYGAPANAPAESSSKHSSSQHQSRLHRNVTITNGSSGSYSTSPPVSLGEEGGLTGKIGGRVVSNAGGDESAGARKATEGAGTGRRAAVARGGGVTKWSAMGAAKKGIPSAFTALRQDSGKFTGVADICKGLPREGEPLTKAVAHAGVRVLVTAGATHLRVWDLCTGVLISSISHDCSGCGSSQPRSGGSIRNRSTARSTSSSSSSETISGTVTQSERPTGQRTNCLDFACSDSFSGGYPRHIDLKTRTGSGRTTCGVIRSSDGELTESRSLRAEAPQSAKTYLRSEAESAHVITDICLDRSGRKVFVADHVGCLCAYSVCTGQVVRRLAPHAAEISHLVYAGEDRNLISVSWDRSIVVHNDAPSSLGSAAASSPSVSSDAAAPVSSAYLRQQKEVSPLRTLGAAASLGAPPLHAVSSSSGEQHRYVIAQGNRRQERNEEMAALQKFFLTRDAVDTVAHSNMAAASSSINAQKQSTGSDSSPTGYRGPGSHHVSSINETSISNDSSSHAHFTGLLHGGCSSESSTGVWKTCGPSVEEREDETSKIWRRVDNAHLGDVTCCAYSRRLGLLATGGVDKAIFVWNYERLRRVACLFGHREDVTVLSFADPLPFLCSADLGGTICIWVLPPHPRAVRVLEAQSAALSCNGRISLPPVTNAESPSGVRSPLLHGHTSTGATPRGGSHDGSGNACSDSPPRSSQVPCSKLTSTSSTNNSSITSGVRERTLITSNVGEVSKASTSEAAAPVRGRQQPMNLATSPVQTPAPVPLVGVHTPRSRPSSASVSYRAENGHMFTAAGSAAGADGTRKRLHSGAAEASDATATRDGFAAQDTYNSNLLFENSIAETGRSPLALLGPEAADEGGGPATLLLVMIEDMENLTGAVPVVSLAALCRRRKTNIREHLPALPALAHALPLPGYAQGKEQQQHLALPESSSPLYLPAASFRTVSAAATAEKSDGDRGNQQVAASREGEQHFLHGYVKKSTTFLTSTEASESCFPQNASSLSLTGRADRPNSGHKRNPSNGRNIGQGAYAGTNKEVAIQLERQPEPEQNTCNRRPTRKKNRSTNETASHLRQQQEGEAAAARDARWPLEAEFLLFAGDEQGRVRVWDVSFLLRQLKGTRFIHKKKEWNPYRIWREELKESTMNIFRERVQHHRQLQQHLTRIVEQEEEADEEMRPRSPAQGRKRQTSPGGTTGCLRAGVRPGLGDGRAATGETAAFSLPSRRQQKKAQHDAAAVQGKHLGSSSRQSSSGGSTNAQRPPGSSTNAAATNDAGHTPRSSHAAFAGGGSHGQEDKSISITEKTPPHIRKESRSFGAGGASGRSSTAGSVVSIKQQQHSPSGRSSAAGDSSRVGNARRGVSFVEVKEETGRRVAQPLQQQPELQGSDRSSLNPHAQKSRGFTGDVSRQQTAEYQEAVAGESGEILPGEAGDPAALPLAGAVAFGSNRRTASGGKMTPAAGTVDVDEEGVRRNRSSNNYASDGSYNDNGTTETLNGFSSLLNGRESNPLFLHAPVRLVASWHAHRDGLKSMQLLPLSNKGRCRPAATTAGTTKGGACVTGGSAAPADTVAIVAANTAARREAGELAAVNSACMTLSNPQLGNSFRRRTSARRKRLLLLTAGGDGAARIWDISGVSSDVAVPALFLDIAEAANTGRRNSGSSRASYSSAAARSWTQAAEDGLRNASCAARAPCPAATFATALRTTKPYAAHSCENVLHPQQQTAAQPETQPHVSLTAAYTNAFPQLQHPVFLVGDLHAQSSNAVAAAAGESRAAEEAAAARGLQLKHPRRLWVLDLDREEEDNADSSGYFSCAEETSSSEDNKTDDENVAQMRLLQLHTRIKELEVEQQQLSARRADIRVEPSLLPDAVLACLPKDEPIIELSSGDVHAFALAERRESNSSSNSSNSSDAC